MKIKKILFSVIFVLAAFTGSAQIKPVLYGGVDYYRNKGFEQNAYVNFHIGSQLFQWYFLAPEVGFEHYYGLVRDVEELNPNDPNARPPSKLNTRFTTNNFSIAPKLKFGNEEASLIVLPQYNFGKISSHGDLLKDIGDRYVLADRQRYSESIAFWSFAAGIEGQFYDSDILHFALLLKYTLLNSEEILSHIDFENSSLESAGGSADGLGVSFRVYFDALELMGID